MTEKMIIEMLLSRIEMAIEQLQRNQSLPALNVLQGTIVEMGKIKI